MAMQWACGPSFSARTPRQAIACGFDLMVDDYERRVSAAMACGLPLKLADELVRNCANLMSLDDGVTVEAAIREIVTQRWRHRNDPATPWVKRPFTWAIGLAWYLAARWW